jgi:hypothetical protein
MAELSIPFVTAILLCDQAITEAGTGKKTLVGIFDRIVTKSIPAEHGPFWLYAKMTDLFGSNRIRLEMIHLKTEKKILGLTIATSDIPEAMRLQQLDWAFPLPRIHFPLEGEYEFQIYANNVFIGRTVLIIQKMAERKP